jgi:hypothetical protein
MLKIENNVEVVKDSDIKSNTLMDYQGRIYASPAQRNFLMRSFIENLRNTVLKSSDTKIVDQNFLKFHSYSRIADMSIYHFQLHEILKNIGDSLLAYITGQGISVINLVSNHRKPLLGLKDVIAFDYNKSLNLISGVYSPSYLQYNTFLYDLKTSKFLFKDEVYQINNIIGKITFISQNQASMFSSGNAKYGSLIDMEKNFAETKIPTPSFINNHDFNESDRMIGMGLEESQIQITNLNCKSVSDSILFEAHQGYVLGFKHLKNSLWISGGEDCAIRLWDIRKTSKPLQNLTSIEFIPVQFNYDEKADTVFALEMYGNINAFQFYNGYAKREKITFRSQCGGMSISQGNRSLYASMVQRVGDIYNGIVKFNY